MYEFTDEEKQFVKTCLKVCESPDDQDMRLQAFKLAKRIDRFGYMPCERKIVLFSLGKVRDQLDKMPYFEEVVALKYKINVILQKLHTNAQ